MKKLLLIDNYDSFTYNLYQVFSTLGNNVTVIRNDSKELSLQFISSFKGIIISPGPGTPSTAGNSKMIISEFKGKTPILGVCLGMQCINEVYGGKTVKAALPVHGKTSNIAHDGSELYMDIPSPFEAARYHSLIIDTGPGLPVTAETDDSIPMSIGIPDDMVWGIQYHPESFLTPFGPAILSNFAKQC